MRTINTIWWFDLVVGVSLTQCRCFILHVYITISSDEKEKEEKAKASLKIYSSVLAEGDFRLFGYKRSDCEQTKGKKV